MPEANGAAALSSTASPISHAKDPLMMAKGNWWGRGVAFFSTVNPWFFRCFGGKAGFFVAVLCNASLFESGYKVTQGGVSVGVFVQVDRISC